MFPVKERFNKCVTKVAANNFVEASFVSSKEGFQQKFPQKLLQVLLKQVFSRKGWSEALPCRGQKQKQKQKWIITPRSTPFCGIYHPYYTQQKQLQF